MSENIFDQWLSAEGEEPEASLTASFKDLPVGAWVVLQAAAADDTQKCALDPVFKKDQAGQQVLGPDGEPEVNFYRMKLVLQPVGGTPDVDPKKGPYGKVYHRFGIDTKDKPGQPGGVLRGFINTFFGANLPHDSQERTAAGIAALKRAAEKNGVAPNAYPNKAVANAALLALALGDERPMVIGRTYLSKSREDVDKQGAPQKTEPRVQVTDWMDFSSDTLAEKGIVVW